MQNYNMLLFKRFKASLLSLIFIFSLILFCGCNKIDVSYKAELSFAGYGADNDVFEISLSEDNLKYEYTLNRFEYFICSVSLNVYQYNNDKLINEKPVYKANISQMQVDFGVKTALYSIYKNEQSFEEIDFCFDNFHLTKNEIKNGAFALSKQLGKHKLQFNIPEMKQYGIEELAFEIILNVVDDSRTKFTEIYVADGETKREPDAILNGIDFYTVTEQPVFRVKDISSGEFLTGNSGSGSGTLPCGGQLFVAYRKLNESYLSNDIEYTINEGLYLCNVSLLNSTLYQSNSYLCYILI